jgi:beta-lactamase superfamily II metal-dependent hydrolase
MDKLQAKVTMYPVGELGDCFFLEFTSGEKKTRVLIDSGSFRNGEQSVRRMRAIAEDIKTHCSDQGEISPIDLVIGTHQHNDHYSNFVHSKDIFESIGIKNAWLSWLDDPGDKHAADIAAGERKLSKKLSMIGTNLQNMIGVNKQVESRIDDILGFYGLDRAAGKAPITPLEALRNLKEISKAVYYANPGEILEIPGFSQQELKAYILGPPRDNELLFDINPGKGESYDKHLSEAMNTADGFLSALSNFNNTVTEEEAFFPFNATQERPLNDLEFSNGSYHEKSQAWRQIDYDWLDQAERLALYLDSFTNNSSLVVAFELVQAQKVLLFVGDAQTGNWLSWKEIDWKDKNTSLSQLLNKTVLYKVGHHCSHNATLPEYLEQMTHPELVAMIPVDISDANIAKQGGWRMPAVNLYKRLKELTGNRILRMDGQYGPDSPLQGELAEQNWGLQHALVSLRAHTELKDEIISYTVS